MLGDPFTFTWTAVLAGLLGAAAMETAMGLITRAGLARGNMIRALGGLVTKQRENAFRVGAIIHAIAAVVFAIGYTLVIGATGLSMLPQSLLLGAGLGFAHGMAVSLALVWVVAEQHPLEEFREADLAIGLCHLVGHVVYGAVVGFVIGLSPL